MLGASSNRLSTPTSDVFELDASPAKNTCSHKRTVVSLPAVLESPTIKLLRSTALFANSFNYDTTCS
ncbi:hypothetical protein BDR05DRAFT_961169, partial [Suillus weaverae]